jgi:hypothetical protein
MRFFHRNRDDAAAIFLPPGHDSSRASPIRQAASADEKNRWLRICPKIAFFAASFFVKDSKQPGVSEVFWL